MAKYVIGVYGDLIYVGKNFNGKDNQVRSPVNISIELPINPFNNTTMDPNYANKLQRLNTALDKASSLTVAGVVLPLVSGNLVVKYGQAGKEKTESFTITSSKIFADIKKFITNNAPRSSIKAQLKAKL